MNSRQIIWRWMYILSATLISTIVLYYYGKALPELIPETNLTKEIVMCSGQLVWQGSIILFFIRKKIHLYLFNMITVSLLGSIVLLPILFIDTQPFITIEIKVVFFLFVVGLMIIEHARRVKKLQLPVYLTITWVCYRILWVPILLF